MAPFTSKEDERSEAILQKDIRPGTKKKTR
jgi:hypothetical protein